jgi:hypothetical protein
MNRIYQGKVAFVEIPRHSKAGNEWSLFHRDLERAGHLTRHIPELREEVESEIAVRAALAKDARERTPKSPELHEYEQLRDEQRKQWQDALWQHHQLFQDAVNYYTFALAVMAEGMTEKDEDGKERRTAMARFAEQVLGNSEPKTDAGYVEGRWDDFVHKGAKRPGLKHSLARSLNLEAGTVTRAECIDRIFGHAFGKFPKKEDGKLNDAFRGAIEELFPAKSRGTPQKLANEDPGWLCWKEKRGEPPADKTYRNQQGLFDFMDRLYQAGAAQLKELSGRSVRESYLSGTAQSEDGDEPTEGKAETGSDSDDSEAAHSASGSDEAGCLVGQDAVNQLEQCVKTAKELLADKAFRWLLSVRA